MDRFWLRLDAGFDANATAAATNTVAALNPVVVHSVPAAEGN